MRDGNLAAATSTGGYTGKMPGRIGDSPIIGAGTYADNRACAVSATGLGEAFIRAAVAHDMCARMRYRGVSLAAAAARGARRTWRSSAATAGWWRSTAAATWRCRSTAKACTARAIDRRGRRTLEIF